MNLRKQLSSYIALNNYVEAIRSSQLPAGYTELEYIESTGTQYIDTGIANWNNTLEYEIKLSIEPQSGIKTCFGCYDKWSTSKNNVPNISTWTNYKVASNFRAGYSSDSGVDIGIRNGQTGTISLKGNTISWSEGFSLSFNRGYDFTAPSSIFLFAQHAGSKATEFATTKIYRAKFWLNGELIRDFRPALDYNNVLGMYDTVSGTFFTNSGTGSFVAGPVYNSPIVLTDDAITNGLTDLQLKGSEVKNKPEVFLDSVVAKGGTEQNRTPTPDAPMDIVCNNGVLKVGPNNSVIVEGTPETVTITGKNLFNESHIKSAAINDVSVVIPVKQNKTYTWSYNKTEYDFRFDSDFVWGVDLNGNRVENGVTLVYANGTYTTASYVTVTVVSPNVVALQTVFRNNTIQPTKENVLASSMQLEEGIRPTKYEEYYQASFALENLLKLGDYQDVQSVLDGIVTRNVGVKVLDGTENWIASSTYFGSCYTYVLDETPAGQVICSHFQNTSSLSDYSRGKCYKETMAFNLWYGDNIATAIADLKQFLADQYAAGTPVIVVYPLANTVEETVESRDVFITSGTNTIERNSEYVSSDGITVKYKKLR